MLLILHFSNSSIPIPHFQIPHIQLPRFCNSPFPNSSFPDFQFFVFRRVHSHQSAGAFARRENSPPRAQPPVCVRICTPGPIPVCVRGCNSPPRAQPRNRWRICTPGEQCAAVSGFLFMHSGGGERRRRKTASRARLTFHSRGSRCLRRTGYMGTITALKAVSKQPVSNRLLTARH